MSWWKRVDKNGQGRELYIPRVDPAKIHAIKLSGVKRMSPEDRATVELLREELTASGFLEREEKAELKPIDNDGDRVFELAGNQGVKNTSSLPTHDSELDDYISSGAGGHNYLLDDDDEDDFDVYKNIKGLEKVSVHKTDDAIELKLPDGTILYGKIPGK